MIDGKSKNKQQKKLSLFATNNNNHQRYAHNHRRHDKLKNEKKTKMNIARRINKQI